MFYFFRGLALEAVRSGPWKLHLAPVAGVAMAAGGFIIASMVYVFHLEKYRPIVRPANRYSRCSLRWLRKARRCPG